MIREKSIIKKEKQNVFQKICEFFKSLFVKKITFNSENIIDPEKSVKTTTLKEELNYKKDIFELQQKYEKGLILEEDMTDNEKEELLNLYNEQIASLKHNISTKKKELDEYKEKILALRKEVNIEN